MVTAIIPAFGKADLTRQAIARLRQQTQPPEEIIVVDDGSPTPFATDEARVLRHDENRGFAAAVNTGLRAARTPLVAILNNDVTLAADWFKRLTNAISGQSADFVCGKLYRPDGRIDGTFDMLCRGGLAWRAGAGQVDGAEWSRGQRISFVSFTAVLARAEVFQEIGGLDETYHSYYEDVEWSLRAAIANKTGYFDSSAAGVHTGSATAGAWSEYTVRQILRNHRRLALQYLLPHYKKEYRVARILLRALCLRHGRWPSVPSEPIAAKPLAPNLDAILAASEAQIRELQDARLSRLYFRWVQ